MYRLGNIKKSLYPGTRPRPPQIKLNSISRVPPCHRRLGSPLSRDIKIQPAIFLQWLAIGSYENVGETIMPAAAPKSTLHFVPKAEHLRASHLRLFISIASIPQRLHLVDKTVQSFAKQTFPPEKILLVLPYKYTRWPSLQPNTSLVHKHALLEIHRCETDDGPGTKSLCAIPRLAAILGVSWTSWPARAIQKPGTRTNAVLILADDDREYKPSALALMADCMLHSRRFASDVSVSAEAMTLSADGSAARAAALTGHSSALALRAFSFATNPLPNSQVTKDASVPSLIVGQGADLFALPLDAILRHDMRAYFELARAPLGHRTTAITRRPHALAAM